MFRDSRDETRALYMESYAPVWNSSPILAIFRIPPFLNKLYSGITNFVHSKIEKIPFKDTLNLWEMFKVGSIP